MVNEVKTEEVINFYLYSEIGRLIQVQTLPNEVRAKIRLSIKNMNSMEQGRLLEALSRCFRNNPVYDFLKGNRKLNTWRLEELDVNSITIAAVNEKVNNVLNRLDVSHKLDKFVEYLKQYFETNPSDDPEGLNEFRQRDEDVHPRKVIVKKDKAKAEYEIIDGVHRAVALVLRGNPKILAYAGS